MLICSVQQYLLFGEFLKSILRNMCTPHTGPQPLDDAVTLRWRASFDSIQRVHFKSFLNQSHSLHSKSHSIQHTNTASIQFNEASASIQFNSTTLPLNEVSARMYRRRRQSRPRYDGAPSIASAPWEADGT